MGTPAQCTAHKRNGERCGYPSVDGSVVCRYHGGGAPLARTAAKKRLLALVQDAVEVLQEALQPLSTITLIQIRAALAVLDRAGFGPTQTVKVEDDRDNLRELTREELEARTKQVLLLLQQQGLPSNDEGTSETSPSPDVVH